MAYQNRCSPPLRRIFGGFAKQRPQATIDPLTGQPSLSVALVASRGFLPKSDIRVLDPIGEDGKSHPLVVVFDRFHALMNKEESGGVIETLRGSKRVA